MTDEMWTRKEWQLVQRVRELEAHDSNLHRARIAGQSQALKALIEQIGSMQYDVDNAEADYWDGFHRCLESLKFWAEGQLRELGEEPREVRNAEPS